jgi:hypothetical protein
MMIETFELPTHWATAFLYGEQDGFEDDELEAIDAFTEYMVKKYGGCYCVEVDSWRWFQHRHDASEYGILATDVSTFTFDVTPE